MATGINKITLLGNLGAQPELKFMPNNNPVLNVSLCTDESYYNDQNQKVEEEEWHKLVVFGRKAESIAKHANKGDQLYIEGKNKTRSWESNGIKRYITEVEVKDFRFTRSSKNPQPAQP